MTATATQTERELFEAVDLKEAMFGDDNGMPVIRNVKILGNISQNDREYTLEARTNALPLYNGAKVNINHPADPHKSRDFQDRFGIIKNPRMGGDNKQFPYGDLYFNPEHPWAKTVMWWAKNAPECLGLSHNAVGQGREDNGRFIVEKIVKVRSVDLVADPATTQTLYEAQKMAGEQAPKPGVKTTKEDETPPDPRAKEGEAKTDKEIEKNAEQPNKSEKNEAEKNVARDEKKTTKEDEIPAPSAEHEKNEPKAEQSLEHKIGHLIIEIVKNKDLSPAEKRKRVLAGLKILPDMGEAEEKSEKPAETATEESVKPAKTEPSLSDLCEAVTAKVNSKFEKYNLELDAYKAREAHAANKEKARKLCQEAKMPEALISDLFLQECAEAKDESKMKALIEDRMTVTNTKATPPAHAGKKPENKAATDTKSFVESLNGRH